MWRAFSWYGIRKLIRFSELWWCVWWLLFWWGFTQIFILSRGAVLLVLWLLALIGVGCFYASSFSRLAQAIGVGINILLMIGGLFWGGLPVRACPSRVSPFWG